MKNVENKGGFVKLNKLKKSTKIQRKRPTKSKFGNGRFIWAKKCKPGYEDKTDLLSIIEIQNKFYLYQIYKK